ncbi:MAG: LeucinetRNA ligase [Candidatus Saccharibacteria bacterium]|nr:LeucinetRNA ligase [Candidatus Saccharibacteria bacterium]
MSRYNPLEIEPKWQQTWDDQGTYVADLSSDKPKYYAMSMFNYPSGAGIHIGHAMNYTISDVMARFKRQNGYESYHPVGWDAFGLPAENFAIKTGISPQTSMAQIIPSYHTQYKAMGWSNDWTKEIATHEPEYYRWTQWIFAEMFKQGLAYQESRMQWWCDIDKTVLSNEQVIDGKCWRHDGADDPLVEKREIKQWFFKITEYADEMLQATDDLDWTESVKLAQKNWIGKSQGAEINFAVNGSDQKLSVFTTRPDTIFGATYLVLAPEHPMVASLTTDEQKQAVENYVKESTKKSELERLADNKDKTGAFTGSYAINPANGEKIPIWVADYVLFGYGTGAIMAVPAHDERDFAFAKKFDLPIIQVVAPETGIKRDNEKFADGGASVVFDPKSQKYAFAKLDNGRTSLFAGGRNDGEDLHEGILRELREESGLTHISYYEEAAVAYGHYYNSLKDINRNAKATALLVILEDAETIATSLEEHEKFHLEWSDPTDILKIWEQDESRSYDHYIYFLKQAVGRAIELGYDTVNNPDIFVHAAVIGEGIMTHSGKFDGLQSSEAREQIVEWLESEGIGESKTTFKIRDWSVSRQRYWGAPIPIINCPEHGPVLVPDADLPVVLPELEDFAPSGDGRSALARATDWLHVQCPVCGADAERETDTLDTYIDSSWYFLRYLDGKNNDAIFDSDIVNKWMPVDFYNGGDHATAHMIYARFVTRFLHKLGLVDTPEPFKKFLFNGKVTASDGSAFSKSKGNGIDPLEIINSGYGADSLRTYLMFAAPLDFGAHWDPKGVPATYRFLNRIWNLVQEFNESTAGESSDAVLKIIHPAIKKVTHDLEGQKYNTAIAAMMKATNELYELKAKDAFGGQTNWRFALESLVALVAPFAPHISEELWHQLGHDTSVHRDSWPQWDDTYLVSDTMTIIVQVNGKLRAKLEVAADASKEDIESLALAHDNVQVFIGDKQPNKVIYVPGKIVNIVVK